MKHESLRKIKIFPKVNSKKRIFSNTSEKPINWQAKLIYKNGIYLLIIWFLNILLGISLFIYVYIYQTLHWALNLDTDIGLIECSPGDQGSIPGWIIPKTQKMVLDATLFNTQHYKVRNKDKVE